jgi:hypothetical protein
MAAGIPAIPVGVDPLIADAKQRARRRRLLALVAIVVAALAASGFGWWFLSPASSRWPAPSTRASGGLLSAHFPDYGLSFRYPANWKRLDCQLETTFTDTITFLTNAPSAECSKIPSYRGRVGSPAIHLGGNGVLVYWLSSGYPGRSSAKIAGRAVTIGGLPAGIRTLATADCASLGGDAGQEATIERPVPGNNWFTATACFRGPNVAANEAAFRRLLASVRIVKS